MRFFLSDGGIHRLNMQAYLPGSVVAQKTRPDLRAGEQAKPESFLRWHYPDQVTGFKAILLNLSRTFSSTPLSFHCKYTSGIHVCQSRLPGSIVKFYHFPAVLVTCFQCFNANAPITGSYNTTRFFSISS